jgi:hypothetical protein
MTRFDEHAGVVDDGLVVRNEEGGDVIGEANEAIRARSEPKSDQPASAPPLRRAGCSRADVLADRKGRHKKPSRTT